jgi:hypothetical protein
MRNKRAKTRESSRKTQNYKLFTEKAQELWKIEFE